MAETLQWIAQFADILPKAVPGDFAQVYGLIETTGTGS